MVPLEPYSAFNKEANKHCFVSTKNLTRTHIYWVLRRILRHVRHGMLKAFAAFSKMVDHIKIKLCNCLPLQHLLYIKKLSPIFILNIWMYKLNSCEYSAISEIWTIFYRRCLSCTLRNMYQFLPKMFKFSNLFTFVIVTFFYSEILWSIKFSSENDLKCTSRAKIHIFL